MTLPASAPIRLQQVATELGVGLPITLAASNVRTLFGVPSGAIRLLQGLGKSNQTRWYATSYTGSASVPTYAYDKEIADSIPFSYTLFTTAAVLSSPTASNGYTEFVLYFGNISVSKVMKLVIALSCNNNSVSVPGYYADCGTGPWISPRTSNPSPAARVTVEICTDGSTYSTVINQTAGLVKYYTNLGGTLYSGTDVRLRFRCYGQGIGEDIYSDLGSGCEIYEGTTSSSSSISIFTALLE